MNNSKLDNYFNTLIEYGVATEQEIILVTNIIGYSEETLNSILYARTGLNNLEQLEEKEDW